MKYRQMIDELTVKYHKAQRAVISEWSGDMTRDYAALRREVNAYRKAAELPPSPVEPSYPEEESED